MAKSKRSSSQPSRQQRRLTRQAQEVRGGRSVGFGVRVAPEHRALAARVWAEVTGGDGVVLVDGKEVTAAP